MIELNNFNFEQTIKNNKIVIVDVKTEWCVPCKTLSPILEQVSIELGNKALIGKLDADQNGEICKELEVRNITTLLFYKDGQIIERTVGMKMKKDILAIVNKLIETETTF